MSAIQLLKWLLISLNTEKLRPTSVDVTGTVQADISKIRIFGNESGSGDTKNFIKYQECLDHLWKHLDTSLSNDLRISRSSCHDSNCSRGSIPILTMVLGSAKYSLVSSCLQRNGSAAVTVRYQ